VSFGFLFIGPSLERPLMVDMTTIAPFDAAEAQSLAALQTRFAIQWPRPCLTTSWAILCPLQT
jgi:hypothetical protein